MRDGALPASEAVIDEILAAAGGLDLVGIYAAGPIWRGFANSEGQRNWHATTAFNLQWSLYHRTDKAVKSGFAGFAWDAAAFAHKMHEARERLALIGMPARALEPGKYRAYLSPSAMEEIAATLCWGGFSGRALKTKQSALVAHAGRRGARPARHARRGHRRRRRARVPGGGLRAPAARAR